MYDYLVVGSGLYGATFAHEAHQHGKSVLVIDKRPNIAGNIYTEKVEGINFHKYGAHIFHTNNKTVWDTSKTLRYSTVSQTLRWLTTKVSYIPCLLICTHSTRCGVW